MNTERHPIRGLFRLLRRLFVLACVLVAAFSVVGYAAGWIEFRRTRQPEKATIEIQTGEVKQAAETAVDKARRLVEDATGRPADKSEKPVEATTPDAPASAPKSTPATEQPVAPRTGD